MITNEPTIAPAELARRVGTVAAPLVFDVRRRAIFDQADRVIAGAKWRDHRRVDDWAGALPRDAAIVIYCVHGHQVSLSAAARLRAMGFNARALDGGIEGYMAVGGPTIAKSDALPQAALGRTRWITRERPKVDRIACPWFIRRFVDPEAEILYVAPEWVQQAAEELGAIPFDIPDTAYSHDGEKCSFDTFLDRFGIADGPLRHLARIIRGADTARLDLAPEAAGLLAASLGLSAQGVDDHTMLDRGMTMYDAFYAWARDARGEGHDWRPEEIGR